MEVKVIEPIKQYIKEFHSPEEFNVWYMKNKDEVDQTTTHKLNKMYKIDGYRITKIQGTLMLKKERVKKSITSDIDEKQNLELNPELHELKTEVQTLKEAYSEIMNKVNQLIELVNKHLS